MGTKLSLERKYAITDEILQKIAEMHKDIDVDGLIALIMRTCLCERRKANELFFAIIPKYPYRKRNSKVWEFIREEKIEQ